MSMESAISFYERLESDGELSERIKELGDRESISRYVKEDLGYDFSEEEMQKVVFERNPELSDEELEAVVGGTSEDMIYGISIGIGIGGGMGIIAIAIAAAGA